MTDLSSSSYGSIRERQHLVTVRYSCRRDNSFFRLVILFYAPSILNDSETIVQEEGRDIALSSAKSISDIAAFAELVDPQAITQPFVNYPFFTAGRFFGEPYDRYGRP